jgi:DNA (cytosine-5)-methyltransferase 3A
MNVLSLFDGISCGRQALERLGIKVDNYFASEIDKYAIKVTMANYPDTIQLGTVIDVDGYKLPKIDLLIGGSPCQSFSFAGKRNGMSTKTEVEIFTLEHYIQLKNEKYEFEGQSYLFWEYMRLLNEVKPKYFLLENVEMGEKWEKVLSRAIGVNGIHLNSSLVSAQNRSRIYWTNIGLAPSGLFGHLESIIPAPKDKKIMLKDIILNDVNPKYYLSENMTKNMVIKSNENASIIGHSGSGGQKGIIHNTNHKCTCLCATDYAQPKQIICHNMQRRNPDRPSTLKNKNAGGSGHLSKSDGKSYCLDAGQSNAIEIVGGVYRTFKDKQGFLPFADEGKCPTLLARARQDGSGQNAVEITTNNKPVIRRLTPIECERLQTIKDDYTKGISDSQRYKCLGNGWTVDIIAYIFSYIK